LSTVGAGSRASIEEQQGDNALRWTGLWPLIGVLIKREKIAEAIDYVRMLLDPSQQPLDDTVKAPLAEALREWDAGRQEEAEALLRQALSPAEQMGYL
jgi:hypothetical protein